MRAVINLSDEGVKLRPLSCVKSGAMLYIGGEVVALRLIKLLKRCDVDNITIITGYMSEGIKCALSDMENVSYIKASPREALNEIAKEEREDFVYISKNIYTDCDIRSLVSYHKKTGAFVTALTKEGVNEYLVSDPEGRVTRVEEKRMWQNISGDNGQGIFIMNPKAVSFITEEDGDVGQSTLGNIVRSGKSVYVKAWDGVCESLTDTASYMRGCFGYLESLKAFSEKGIIVEEGAVVEKGAILEAPCYIGKNSHIHKGAKVGAYTLIGAMCSVSEGANIKRSIIAPFCHIGADCTLRGCVLDEGVRLGRSVTVYEQAVIGYSARVGPEVLIKSFVKIWPEKTIEKGAIVSENIMWGQKKRTSLFECGKIKGVVNEDITPVFCTLLGAAAGAVFNFGEVGVSTDDSTSGAMLRDAIVSGLMGSGCSVKDFGEQPLPITRRGTAFYSLKGAVCISVNSASGEDVAEITIIGNGGLDIDEKMKHKLMELFEKGDIVYPESKSIKECEYVFEYKLYYLKSIVDYKKDNRLPMKVLLNCPVTWGKRLISSAMADFNCPVSIYQSDTGREGEEAGFVLSMQKGGFDIGFIMDTGCEKLKVVYGGKIIDEDTYEALTALIIMKKYKNARIYVPVTAGGCINDLGEKYGCEIIRTKTAPPEIMKHMAGGERYLSEEFIFRFDAVGAVILLMNYLTGEKVSLAALLEEIPSRARKKVVVDIPEGRRYEIMDKIHQLPSGSEAEEGVKITFDKGWVIVIPDMEKEVFNVVSEGVNMETAEELCDFLVKCIE
ncbi:MAG: hypothetical protein IKU60_06140 [Clostridia bacterium]|nr:hypothetical protein [Clostridia bacterium]